MSMKTILSIFVTKGCLSFIVEISYNEYFFYFKVNVFNL